MNQGIKIAIPILFGIALVLYGIALQLLFFTGKTSYAHIAFNERVFWGRHPRTYITHYTFTLPDKSLMTGEGYLSVRSGEPRGMIKIRYFSFYPSFNALSGPGLIVYSLFFISAGLLILIPAFRQMGRYREDARYEKDSASSGGFLAAVVFISFAAAIWLFFDSNTELIISDDSKLGNLPSNIANDGRALFKDGYIYYTHWADKQKIYKVSENGGMIRKINDDPSSYLNIKDDFIYYSNFSDNSCIYRIRTDGTRKSRIYKWRAKNIILSGNWLFFINENDYSRLYRTDIEGGSELKLNNDQTGKATMHGEWIYYTNSTDDGCLYKIKNNGDMREKLTDFPVTDIFNEGSYIFFVRKADKKLCSYHTDSRDIVEITDFGVSFFNKIGDMIYYRNPDNGFLYRYSMNSRENDLLQKTDAWFINVVNDNILFIDCWESGKTFLWDTAGRQSRVLE